MSPSLAATNGSILRILIVDDNHDAAHVLGVLLQRYGCEVDVVTDSTQCLSHVESFCPDVILLDIGMPEVGGYELARQIRTKPGFERLAIIAISGYADAQHTRLSFDAGCDQHLVKPVRFASLEIAIADEVKKRRSFETGICESAPA